MERYPRQPKNQAPNAVANNVNAIGRCELEERADTCCAGKNRRLLSTTGQLCYVKRSHNSYEAINNVQVGISATSVVNDNITVYIVILNEDLLFGK